MDIDRAILKALLNGNHVLRQMYNTTLKRLLFICVFVLFICLFVCFQRSRPVYMVSGTRDNPPPRDNFTERLYGVVSCNSCPL